MFGYRVPAPNEALLISGGKAGSDTGLPFRIVVGHEETPSPLNPLGVKGAGEAGAIPVGALFAQALEDALAGSGLEITEIPLSGMTRTRPENWRVSSVHGAVW